MRRIWARVFPAGAFLLCEWGLRRGGGCEARPDDGEGLFDLGVARAELDRVEIKERERLPKDKEMLRAPGPGQG